MTCGSGESKEIRGDGPLPRRNRRQLALFVLFFSLLASQQLLGDPCDKAEEKFAVFFVIDRSGSMAEVDYPLDGKLVTRIEGAKNWALEQAENLDFGTYVWICEFEGNKVFPGGGHELVNKQHEVTLHGPPEREKLKGILRDLRVHQKEAGTAVYDATGLAMNLARAKLKDGWVVSVITLTDGKDQGGATTPPQQKSIEFRDVKDLKGVYDRFPDFQRDDSTSSTLAHIHFGGRDGENAKKTADLPLSVRVSPARISLGDPVANPNPVIELCISIPGYDGSKFLSGFDKIDLSFPEDSPVQIGPLDSIEFREGSVKIPLQIIDPDNLPTGKALETELTLTFPHEVGKSGWSPRIAGAGLASNEGKVKLSFLTGSAPVIGAMIPREGDKFLAGELVDFRVDVSPGMKVVWDVDGKLHEEARFQEEFKRGGVKTATVFATDGKRTSVPKQVHFMILDYGLVLDPIAEKIVAGEPFRFTATPKGEFENFVWYVDGRPFARDTPDLEFTFDEGLKSRTHNVYVVGNPKGVDRPIPSLAQTIEVWLKPNGELEEPSGGRAFFNQPVHFRYRITGDDVDRMNIQIQNEAGYVLFRANPPAILDASGQFRVVEFDSSPIAPSGKPEKFKIIGTLQGKLTSKVMKSFELPFQSEIPEPAIEFPKAGDGKIQSGRRQSR
ncbi:MAG: hypothetical protein ACI8UO_002682 [Verrucomicrobiales bacterium]|jgi:hypothetical protein